MRLAPWLAAFIALAVAGCGGSSGGSSPSSNPVTLVGRVLDIKSGSGPSPAATLTTSLDHQTTAADGSFTIGAPSLVAALAVDASGAGYGTWNFSFPPAGSATTDVGELWVGPERVDLTGRVLDSATGLPIGGATVSFGGASTTSKGDGTFTVPQIAYSSATQVAFWGIQGLVQSTNHFTLQFNAAPNVASGGVVGLGDIILTPSNDPNPPPTPYSISGRVLPLGTSNGAVVTLKQNGSAIRIVSIGPDGRYAFWIGPGTYQITYAKGSLSAPAASVTVASLGGTVSVPDATLQ